MMGPKDRFGRRTKDFFDRSQLQRQNALRKHWALVTLDFFAAHIAKSCSTSPTAEPRSAFTESGQSLHARSLIVRPESSIEDRNACEEAVVQCLLLRH